MTDLTQKITKNWQKTCDSVDYSDPDFNLVLNEYFRQPPTFHRKQWEFVVIFLNLLKYDKLQKNLVGASFGAGRERLIFDVAKHVESFTATDLYVYNTAWATAKVEKNMSCFDFVMEKAPKDFDASGLSVKEMDMRKLDFEDRSLDFAYSSCAFEHIGHFKDFVAHLKQVKRVLKDDGVYVMTTEHLFDHDTLPVKGNYKFDFSYLLDVFKAADFFPESVFDDRLNRGFLNKPKPELLPLNGFTERMQNFLPSLVIAKHGIPYTSSCFVFHKNDPNEKTIQRLSDGVGAQPFLKNVIRNNVLNTYEHYQSLDPTLSLRKEGRTVLRDHLEYLVDDFEEHMALTPIGLSQFAFTDFIYFDDFKCRFSIKLSLAKPAKIKIELVEQSSSDPKKRACVEKVTKKVNGYEQVKIDFEAQKDKVYAVTIYAKHTAKLHLKQLDILAKVIS